MRRPWRRSLDGIVAIGGEGTLGAASKLAGEGVSVIGVPKTIDNDIAGNGVTVGFHTAVQVATDAIDRLHSTAESHDRVIVVEVMGRNAGWIALYAGIAGGADVILIPEQPFDLEEVCPTCGTGTCRAARSRSSWSAEGAVPAEGTGFELPPWGWTRTGSRSSAVSRTCWRPRSRAARATRRASRSSGTCSAAGRRSRSTGSSATRLGPGRRRSRRAGGWGRMVALAGAGYPSTCRSAPPSPTRNACRRSCTTTAEVFFG